MEERGVAARTDRTPVAVNTTPGQKPAGPSPNTNSAAGPDLSLGAERCQAGTAKVNNLIGPPYKTYLLV